MQTVRVWDISGLRKKTVSPGGEDVLRLPQVRRFVGIYPAERKEHFESSTDPTKRTTT